MKIESIGYALANPRLYFGRHRHILLLSHMRCYTSLLGHIFGSNSKIAGFAELHMPYCGVFDLMRMRKSVYELTKHKYGIRGIYFDKLLHNKCYVHPSVMKMCNVDFVVSIRRPEDTILSIINMGKKYHDIGWYQDPFSVVQYYTARLAVLSEFVERLYEISGRQAIFFEAEKLIDQPGQLLSDLSQRLSLSVPLSETYEVFGSTGQPGIGDPSNNIKAGRIVKGADDRGYVQIDPILIAWAEKVYQSSLELAYRNCVII